MTSSTACCTILTVLLLHQFGGVLASDIPRFLGLWPVSPLDCARTILLVAVLFLGPLFEYGVVDGHWRDWIMGRELYQTLSSWIGYRNYVAVRPSLLKPPLAAC